MELKHPYNFPLIPQYGLLIVPYGIETKYVLDERRSYPLLIVPYGIETQDRQEVRKGEPAFNRTLWN